MKILSLNLCNDPKLDNNLKYHLISDFIIEENIDIVILQEVFQSQSEDIAYENVRFYNKALLIQNIMGQKGGRKYHEKIHMFKTCWDIYDEGLAVISKYPIVKSFTKTISNITDYENYKKRDMLNVVVDHFGKLISISNLHLGWTDKTENWQDQFDKAISAINESTRKERIDCSIIAGDFNISSDSPEFKYIESLGYKDLLIKYNINFKNKATFKELSKDQTNLKNGHIDYIITKNDLHVSEGKLVLDNDLVGDHKGILINISV